MPKYMFIGRYTAEGARGMMKEGGSGRVRASEQIIGSVGGTVLANYWGFGEDDFYVIAELPDNAAAAAASLAVGGSGAVGLRTVVLMTAEEVDEATRRSADYRPPGA